MLTNQSSIPPQTQTFWVFPGAWSQVWQGFYLSSQVPSAPQTFQFANTVGSTWHNLSPQVTPTWATSCPSFNSLSHRHLEGTSPDLPKSGSGPPLRPLPLGSAVYLLVVSLSRPWASGTRWSCSLLSSLLMMPPGPQEGFQIFWNKLIKEWNVRSLEVLGRVSLVPVARI